MNGEVAKLRNSNLLLKARAMLFGPRGPRGGGPRAALGKMRECWLREREAKRLSWRRK